MVVGGLAVMAVGGSRGCVWIVIVGVGIGAA